MKKRLLFLFAMLISIATGVQAQSLTVADGTATSSYIPVYGLWMDAAQHNQIIYPASMLTAMESNYITTVSWYLSSPAAAQWNSTVTVTMAEVTDTSLSGLMTLPTDATLVWTGIADGTGSMMTLILNTPYEYQGGNLLVDITTTAATFKSASFYGISSPAKSYYSYNTTSNTQNFLPKTTFTYNTTGAYCYPVENLAITNVSYDELSVSWNTGGTETSWAVSIDGGETWNTSSDTTYTFSGLNSNTSYTVSVVSLCGSSDSSMVRTVSARTACNGYTTIPYTEDFESNATGEAPNCWLQVATGANSGVTFPSVYVYSSNTRNGNGYFEFEASANSSDTEIVALPEMQDINSLRLSMWVSSSSSYPCTLEVGVLEADGSFTRVDSLALITFSGASNWKTNYHEYVTFFNEYTGSGERIAIRAIRSGSGQYTLFVDDLAVTMAGAAEITSMPALLGTDVNTDLVITATVGGDMTAGTYTWSSLMADAGNATMTPSNNQLTINYTAAGIDTVTLIASNSLGEDTAYTVVRVIDMSPVTEFPYSTGFEADDDNNWIFVNDAINHWVIDTAVNNGGARSLYISNDSAASYAYTTTTAQFSYAYRAFSLAEAGQYAVSFDWKGYGESNWDYLRAWLAPATAAASLVEGQDPEGGVSSYSYNTSTPAGWIDLGGKMNQQSAWQTVTATPSLQAGNYIMVFMWANDGYTGTQPPAAVDNIVVTPLACPAPTALAIDTITAHEITIHWTAGGDETAWNVYVNGNVIEGVTSNPYTITDLEQYSYYTLAVRAMCGGDDSSFLSSSIIAHTLIACPWPVSFDVTTGGDTATFSWTDSLGSAWELVYGPMGIDPDEADNSEFVSTNSFEVTGLETGFYEAYLRTDCGTDQSVWVGPLSFYIGFDTYIMNATGTDTLNSCAAIIYDDGGASGSYANNANSTLVIYPSEAGSVLTIHGSGYVESSTWDHLKVYEGVGTSGRLMWQNGSSTGSFTMPLDTSSVGPLTIVFQTDNSGSYSGFELFVSCVEGSSCMRPMSVNAVATSASDVTVDIVGDDNASYRVYWTDGTTVDSATVNGSSYIITGLAATTTYTVSAATICDDGGLSHTTSTTVRTQCAAGSCDVVIEMEDSYGDGWNGNAIVGYVGGSQVFRATIASGDDDTYTYSLCATDALTLIWDEGSYSDEASFNISNGDFELSADGDDYDDGDTIGVINGCPSCIRPSNLTVVYASTDSITLSWTGNATSYNVYTVTPTDTTFVQSTTATTYTFAGLNTNTAYVFGVSAFCGGTDSSAMAIVSGRTACGDITVLPWTEDFNAMTATTTATDIPCWEHLGGGYVNISGSYAVSGNSLRFYPNSSSTPNIMVLPSFAANIDGLELSFQTRPEGSYSGSLSVGYVTDATDASTFVELAVYPVADFGSPIAYMEVEQTFAGAPAGARMALRHNVNSTVWYWFVDEIDVHVAPSCTRPTVTLSNITESSVTVDLTDANNVNNYVLVLTSNGTVVDSTVITTTTHTYTTLGASTAYSLSARTLCTDGTMTRATTVSFRTLCGPASLPYGEDFENMATSQTPECWDNLNGTTQTSTSYPHAGSKSLKFSGSTSGNMVAMPALTQDISNVTLTFWTRPESVTTSSCGTFDVGYIANVADTSTFVVVETYSYNDSVFGVSTATYAEKTVTFAGAPTGARIAFRHNAGSTIWYWFVDDITITSDQPDPGRYMVSATTADATMGSASVTPSGNVAEGTTVTFTATPAADFAFEAWMDGDQVVSTENPYVTVVYSNLNLTAVFGNPCGIPTNLTATDVTVSSAILAWTAEEGQTAWQIAISGTGRNDTLSVTTNPYTISNLNYDVTYTFSVRAVCSATNMSEWSAPQTFTTVTCQTVTGVTVSDVTSNSAVISWTAPAGATNFEVEYGPQGFQQGTGSRRTVNDATTYTITGLADNSFFDAYVRTICGEGVASDWSTAATIHTAEVGIDDVVNANVNLYPNPASSTVTLTGIEGMATVTVVDMNGRESGKWTVTDGTLTIDVTEMAQGAYFVRIVGEQVNVIRKLIVR